MLEVFLGSCYNFLPFSIKNISLLPILPPNFMLHDKYILSYLLLEVEVPLPASLDLLFKNLAGILFLLDGVEKLLDLFDVLWDSVGIVPGGRLLLCERGGEVDPVGDTLVDAEGAAIHTYLLLCCWLALHFFEFKLLLSYSYKLSPSHNRNRDILNKNYE